MTAGTFLWQCPNTIVAGGLLTKVRMLGVGALVLGASVLPGLRMRAAFSRREGAPATPAFRVILFFIGGVVAFEAIRLLPCG